MTEVHSEKQIMTYTDKDIDRLIGELKRIPMPVAHEIADMLAQYKIDRAFLRTREDQMRGRIHDVEEQLVKAAIMITEARERAESAEKKLSRAEARLVELGQWPLPAPESKP